MFCSNINWLEKKKKKTPNFPYLACYKIELFSKKKKILETTLEE